MLLLIFQDFLEWQWFSIFCKKGKRRPRSKQPGFPPFRGCPWCLTPAETSSTSRRRHTLSPQWLCGKHQGIYRPGWWSSSHMKTEHDPSRLHRTQPLNHHSAPATRGQATPRLKTRKTKCSDQTPLEEPKEPTCLKGQWFSYTRCEKHKEFTPGSKQAPRVCVNVPPTNWFPLSDSLSLGKNPRSWAEVYPPGNREASRHNGLHHSRFLSSAIRSPPQTRPWL